MILNLDTGGEEDSRRDEMLPMSDSLEVQNVQKVANIRGLLSSHWFPLSYTKASKHLLCITAEDLSSLAAGGRSSIRALTPHEPSHGETKKDINFAKPFGSH